jgi:hypothetical protein
MPSLFKNTISSFGLEVTYLPNTCSILFSASGTVDVAIFFTSAGVSGGLCRTGA